MSKPPFNKTQGECVTVLPPVKSWLACVAKKHRCTPNQFCAGLSLITEAGEAWCY